MNLAKARSAQGDKIEAEGLLWQALLLDPNLENAVQWWGAIHRERGGVAGFLEAMQRVAALPESWRAQLWLARDLLAHKQPTRALELYRSVLPLAVEHGDALMMITGDLGNSGYKHDAVHLIAPLYEPTKHGPFAGINLLQACITIGDASRGREMLRKVETLDRHDVKSILEGLRVQLERLR